MTDISSALRRIDDDLDSSVERLFELLRIPSISTDPSYSSSCVDCANHLSAMLTELGFSSTVHPTPGHPILVSRYAGPPPHLLFYGHYDVQPVDPLDLWDSAPFEPVLVDSPTGEHIRARGSSDDKGQLMTFVEACRAWIETTGSLPCGVTILLEGEEECGSLNMAPFLESHADELKSDLALVCDTNMWDSDTPAITTSLRGMASEEIIVRASDRDLHSGYYGGAARNPIHVLCDILGGLRDKNGRVTLPNFYDGVTDIPPDVKNRWNELGFCVDEFLGSIGLSVPAGESDYSALEQIWSRPTAEVNGIIGGYTGDGFKTVIPSEARAKVSFRLVGEQDPLSIIDSFHNYVGSCLPPDCSVEFIGHARAPAITIDYSSPLIRSASVALSDEWEKPAALISMGGSVPIVSDLKELLGMDSLMVGFGLSDDNIHSPNEKYDMRSYHKGTRSWCRILDSLSSPA